MTAHRVVVVGHGMVGSRLVHELCRTVPGRLAAPLDVTVLGAEPYDAYNRLLLSEVLAGRADLAGLILPAPPDGVRVHRGTSAVALDLAGGAVLDDAGTRHPFDTVVMATGAAARVPDLDGLVVPGEGGYGDPHLVRGATPLRTVDDCRMLLAAAGSARTAVVLGGGLLGLEAATALAGRGVEVGVVHRGPHVLDRQLGAVPGEVVGAALGDLGVTVRTGARATRVHTRDGAVAGLELDGGEVLPADLLVLAAGVVPRVGLARDAGLPVGHGVLVGDDLRSPADRRVAAVGDCAESPSGCPGLLAPGWDQAARLAVALRHPHDPLPVSRDEEDGSVVRLKASGLDVVTMGETSPAPGSARELQLLDPAGRRAVSVLVHGDRLVGATCVGAGRLAADLTVAYERRTPLPQDPALLLVADGGGAPVTRTESPTRLPDGATVCRCNGVAKRDIVAAWSDGARSVGAVAACTRATTGCGGCTATVQGLLDWLARSDPDTVEAGPAGPTSQAGGCGCEQTVAAAKPSAAVLETSRA